MVKRAGAVLATSVALVSPLLVPSTASAIGAGCAPYVAVLVPGTTETNENADPSAPAGMLGQVGAELKDRYGDQIQVVYPPYPAEAFFNGEAYASSKASGDQAASDAMARCQSSRFVLGGYSQGAHVANDVAVNIGHGLGPVPAQNVLSVALLANPKTGTSGAKLIGPAQSGQGIAGPAPEGFGALAGKVTDICNPTDTYCNTSPKSSPFLAALGRLISNPPGAVASTSAAATTNAATQSLNGATTVAAASPGAGDGQQFLAAISPGKYRNADLSAVAGSASRLADSVANLQGTGGSVTSSPRAVDIARIAQQARLVTETLEPVAKTQSWLTENPGTRDALASAPESSPEAVTSQVLGKVGELDIPALLTAASSVLETTESLLGARASASTTATAAAPASYDSLVGPAQALASGTGALADTPADQLRTATSVLSALQPKSIIDQILNVVAGVTSVDYPAVAAGLQQLPNKIVAGDIPGTHKLAGDLNNQLSPLVKMAAGVDLKTVSRLVAMVPDPSGTAATVSMVAGLLGNVDVIRLARNVGQIQEIAWKVLETGNPLALSQLLPVGLDLATVAAGVLMPGQKMSADQLAAPADPVATLMSAQADKSDFVGLGTSAVSLASSEGAQSVALLAKEGLTAANFYASGAHQSYGEWQPTGKGTALDTILAQFTRAIGG